MSCPRPYNEKVTYNFVFDIFQAVRDIFELSVSHYSEVRSYAQDLLFKIGNRVIPESHALIIPMLVDCLKPGVPHQQFKGALYILSMEKYGFFYSWKYANMLIPALVEAQHSDKQSIVDLLKDFRYLYIFYFTQSRSLV